MSWIEYLGPIGIAMSLFLIQMVFRNNTRCSVLESRVKQLESKEGDYKQNFTKLFEALQDIKVEIAKLSLAKK